MIKTIIHYLHLLKQYILNSIIINKKFYNLNNTSKRIVLIGSPEHQNIGDHAISIAEMQFFHEHFKNCEVIEITGNTFRKAKKHLLKKIKPDDLIVLTGGGLMGDLWPEEENMIKDILSCFSNNPIIIMPQTVYFSNIPAADKEKIILKQLCNDCKNLTVFCREQNSYSFFNNYVGTDAFLFPDMVLYFDKKNMNLNREYFSFCLRKDIEEDINNHTNVYEHLEKYVKVKEISTVADVHISLNERDKYFLEILGEIAKSKILITDRLHAMLFAYITQTPCIAIDNLSKKVSGVYKWIENCGYIKILENCKDLDELMQQLIEYDFSKVKDNDFKAEFTQMAEIIKERQNNICTRI